MAESTGPVCHVCGQENPDSICDLCGATHCTNCLQQINGQMVCPFCVGG